MVRDWDLNADHSRGERFGLDETVFCAGKSADHVRRILQGAVDTGIPLLQTRLEPDKVARLPDRLSAGSAALRILKLETVNCRFFEPNTHTVD